jgi:stearoyl-CoA desaturase (delta-9 desaturase)
MPEPVIATPYDGASPFPDAEASTLPFGGGVQVGVTALLSAVPLVGLAVAIWLAWGRGVGLADLAILALLYVITGLGVTVGYHRLFTHGSFRAAPALRVALAVAASMSFEGTPISWVATHRRHHAFSDRPGDPHSPFRYGTSVTGMARGLLHAHIGWMFLRGDAAPADRYAPDLLADRNMRIVSRAFPAITAASLAIPFGVGWALTGDLRGALLALLWGGLVRVALLQHVTWSVNSLCHVLGRRPFSARRFDRAANFWPLALPSFGESWHNYHHSDPTSARHGAGRGEVDISAGVIALFERLGWVWDVRWPSRERIEARRRTLGSDTGPSAAPPRLPPGSALPEPSGEPAAATAVR